MLQCCIFLLWGLFQMVQLDGLCPELVALGGCCMYSARRPLVVLLLSTRAETCRAYFVCQFRLAF